MIIDKPYYEDNTRISNSSIGWFLKKGPLYFRNMLDGKEEGLKLPQLEKGTMIHEYILQPDEFWNDYVILQYDVTKVKHAAGIAPIAPIDPDGLKAMGKTNDAVLFGGRTYYYVESDENDDIADVAAKLPSSAADGYGKPFFDVFKEAEFDFYKIDKGMFAPAEVVINDLTTGKIYKEGYVNVDLLKKAFGVDN